MSAREQEEDGKTHALKERARGENAREREGGREGKAEYIRTYVAEGETSRG